MIGMPKGKKTEARVLLQSAIQEHAMTSCFVCTLMNEGNRELHKPGTSLPLGPSPFPPGAGPPPLTSPAPVSWGGRLRDARLRVKTNQTRGPVILRPFNSQRVQWVISPLGLEGWGAPVQEVMRTVVSSHYVL